MRLLGCLGSIVGLALASVAWPAELIYREQTPPQQAEEAVVRAGPHVFVNRRDFNDAMSVTYYHAALEVYRKQRAWLDWYIGEQLLALRAWEQKKLPEDFLRDELKIHPELDKKRWAEARHEYVERLKKQAKLSIILPPEPVRPRIAVTEGNTSPVMGLADAPLAVVQFCRVDRPECRENWRILREVVRSYGWRIRLAHRDAVGPEDGEAFTAAVAARCAHQQGKFWDYYDRLNDHSGPYDAGTLKGFARTLKLEVAVFDRCLDERATAQEVARDGAEARRLGIAVFPALFANTTYVHGLLPKAELIRILESVTLR